MFTVLIMSCGIVKDRILSTRGNRWVEHVANKEKNVYTVWRIKLSEREFLEDLSANEKIILKYLFKE
jgi:hypothetical protein